MRILQIIQKKQLRGAEVFASQISEHMKTAGHEVMVISLVDGNAVLPTTIEVSSLDADLSKKFFDIKGWRKLSEVVGKFKPDVVQANAGDTLKYAVFSRMFFGWKAPIVFRNASVISRYLRNPVSRALTKFLVRRADHIASVSNLSARDIQQLFGLDSKKISVIPIGIEEKEVRKLNCFNNGKRNIVHVGGFTFEKNHEGMLRILKHCLRSVDSIHLWLVGEGPLKSKIEAQAAEQGLNEHLTFVGHVNNPMDYIHSAEVCILPSIIEGLPGVVAESFYCRTPVVAYEVGGISDLVQSGTNGWLVKAGDEQGFASRVIEVLNMDALQNGTLEDSAFNTVTNGFKNSVLAQRFTDLYQNIKER